MECYRLGPLTVDAVHASFSGDANGAVDRFEILVTGDPDDYWLHSVLVGLYQLSGRIDDAESEIGELERIRPGFYVNQWQAGFHHLFERGDLATAADAFARVADAMPELPMPLAEMAPSLLAWEKGQVLVFRSRLLAEMGEMDAACRDQAMGAALFDEGASLGLYHTLELALLLIEMGDAHGRELLDALCEAPSALFRAQALGWLGVETARSGDVEGAERYRGALRELGYDGGWEFGYPTRPAFDRARVVFPLLIDGHLALGEEDPARAALAFVRARRAAPERMSVVPVVSLDGRAHLAAVEGMAVSYDALGEHSDARAADRWLTRHRLETVIVAQAGTAFLERAEARGADQLAGITSAAPMEKSNGPVAVPE